MERHRRQITSNLNCPSTWGRGRAVRLPEPNLYASDVPFHFTIGANNGAPFDDAMIAAMVCNSVQKSCELLHFRLYIYCLMPDHLHLFCAPRKLEIELSSWVRHWKRGFSLLKVSGSGDWQRDYWDTRLRRHESYSEKWAYDRNKPVRAGLVEKPENWPFWGVVNE